MEDQGTLTMHGRTLGKRVGCRAGAVAGLGRAKLLRLLHTTYHQARVKTLKCSRQRRRKDRRLGVVGGLVTG